MVRKTFSYSVVCYFLVDIVLEVSNAYNDTVHLSRKVKGGRSCFSRSLRALMGPRGRSSWSPFLFAKAINESIIETTNLPRAESVKLTNSGQGKRHDLVSRLNFSVLDNPLLT
ncbi:hypothetical protein VNO77_16226 [Canavalia gladiata]|uniref:Secreted protein n=1 Tax=Canavalia gladiata TaxID=3824 RepID=A0AAN9QRU8_CANGL